MFWRSTIGNLNISSFDTQNVTNMSGMFDYFNYNDTLDLSHFNTSLVSDFSEMFWGAN